MLVKENIKIKTLREEFKKHLGLPSDDDSYDDDIDHLIETLEERGEKVDIVELSKWGYFSSDEYLTPNFGVWYGDLAGYDEVEECYCDSDVLIHLDGRAFFAKVGALKKAV